MNAPPPDARRLAGATFVALLVAGVVLVTAILPAEYGLDPTGLGRLTGFLHLGEHGGPEIETPPSGGRTLAGATARWEVTERVVGVHEGRNEGEFTTQRVTLPLNVTNLTKLIARLDWWDNDTIEGARTLPDRFELGIDAPGGRESQRVQAENGPDGRGNATASLSWRSLPSVERNATAGRVSFPLLPADESSHGEWTFTVRLYAAGARPDGSGTDPGNAWRLTLTAETYALEFHEEDGPAGDRVTIKLRPQEGIEYKFHLQPGARLHYAWTSTAPLYWDLHAEEDGRDPDDFTRFAEGRSAGERGSLTATFPGQYGWYWLNEGRAPVSLTLETRGAYEIVGVPS